MPNPTGPQLLSRLNQLFHYASQGFLLHQKIAGIANDDGIHQKPFTFFRCFIPYYYDMLDNSVSNHNPIATLHNALGSSQCEGHIFGDSHPENFGMMYNNRFDNAIFSMNDSDDGGHRSLYQGILRFYSAVILYDDKKNALLPDLYAAYLKGLDDKKAPSSPYIEEMINDSMKDEKKQTSKDYEKKFEKDKKKKADLYPDQHQDLADWEIEGLKKIVKEAFSGLVKFQDGFSYVKVVGGSGGLRRYRMLVKFKDKKNPRKPNKAKKGILEMKELTEPGVYPCAYFTNEKIERCILENLANCQQEELGIFYQGKQFNGKPWELRPRWNKYKGIDLDDTTEADATDEVLIYEAYTLGKLHRNTADNLKNYQKALTKTSNDEWTAAAEYVRELVVRDYETLAALSQVPPQS